MSNNNTTSKLPPVPSNNVLRAYACWVFREIDNNSTSATSRIEYFLAHLFSSFCPFLDRPTVKSFKVWLKRYDNGEFDVLMMTHGMRRDVFRIIHPSAGAAVLAAMIKNLDTDDDVDAARKLTVDGILESAEAVQMSLRLPLHKYSKRWASRLKLSMILRAQTAVKNDSSHRIIEATNVNVLSGQWKGVLEDRKYDARRKKLVDENMTYEKQIKRVGYSRNPRKVNRGYLYQESDKDETCCLKLDIAEYPPGTSVTVHVVNEEHDIHIALIPKKDADKLADLLKELYVGKSDGGIGFKSKDLNNSMRDNPLGWMTSFGILDFVKGVVTHYKNTEDDVICGGRSSYEILGNMTAAVYERFIKKCTNKLQAAEAKSKNNLPNKQTNNQFTVKELFGSQGHVKQNTKSTHFQTTVP